MLLWFGPWTLDVAFGPIGICLPTSLYLITARTQDSINIVQAHTSSPSPDIVWHWYNRNAVFLGPCLWKEGVCMRTNDHLFAVGWSWW